MLFSQIGNAQNNNNSNDVNAWVESIFNSMSEEERLGQLFMIRAHSDKGPDHIKKVTDLIKAYHVGGLCFFQGTPEKQAALTNDYQKLATKVPLMLSMDAEWGLGMRLKKETISFPRQLALGAIQDNSLIYKMGNEVADQCRRLGVHINFAPVADVNNNPKNPVINTRSFGEDRYNVAAKSYMYALGMQDKNVMACAKHFPGHGDTDVDSHYDLPVISHDMTRLDSIELFPFKMLAQQGIQSMMVAHLHVPTIDNRTNRPTTLSKNAIRNLLQKKLGFNGLIFTDGLGMKGVTKHYKPGVVEAEALVAGNDILLLPQDVEASVKAINEYIESGKLSRQDIHNSVKKVLAAKFMLGLKSPQTVEIENLNADLNNADALSLKRKLIEHSLTLVRNEDDLVPFQNTTTTEYASLSIGSPKLSKFQSSLAQFTKFEHFNSTKEISASNQSKLLSQLSKKDIVIVGLHDMSSYASKGFGLSESAKSFVNKLSKQTKVILVVFGNPYCLQYFDEVDNVLVAYDEGSMHEDVAAKALFGGTSIRGKLPITASPKSKFGNGVSTMQINRMGMAPAESVGINGVALESKVDSLMKAAIEMKATPGGVVLVAKDGKIILNKAYGYHTYSKKNRSRTTDLFDLASITKIAATTISVMKLVDEGKLDVEQPLSRYLTPLQQTNKSSMSLKEIMCHRAGLKPWIPFFEQTVSEKKQPLEKFYKKKKAGNYSVLVTDKLYMEKTFVDTMWNQIFDSELRERREYKYSDLGFYMLSRMVKDVSGMSLDKFALKNFYSPLGLVTATYKPLERFSKSAIVPTEDDNYWRQQLVHGHVHDMGAAMLGGVSGHAGLFGTASDLAVIMQMLLNGGSYGGVQYLKPETVRKFTTRHPHCTRRGIGFDMKELDASKSQNMGSMASNNTFGHLGFTGTVTWADPDHDLIYVFLSNRTFPSMHNYKLNKEDFRPKIQNAIYESMIK